MKRRIISSVLVVVMLVLSLASCAYNYAKDYESCVTFDKAAFEAAMKTLTVEDGEFTADEETRKQRVLDAIYADLAADVDKTAKMTEGTVNKYDMLYYCYYITYTEGEGEEAKEVTVYAASMKESSAVSFQLGLSKASDLQKKIAEAILGNGEEGSGYGDFKDNAYSTTTSSSTEVKEGDVIVVTYKATTNEKSTTYTNIKLVAKDDPEANGIHNEVAKAFLGTGVEGDANKDPAKITKALESFKSADETTTYTGAVVNWVIKSGKEAALVTDTTYTTTTTVTDVEGVSRDLKNKELTYHVYPVYYLEVEDYTAEIVIESLLSSVSTSSLKCFKDAEDVIKAYNDAVSALDTAETELDEAEDAVTAAQKAVTTAEGKVAEGANKDEDANVINAKKALDAAKATRDTKKTAKEDAEKKVDEAVTAIVNKVGADAIIADYDKYIYDDLLTKYNTEVKMNLAKGIYDLILKYAVAYEDAIPDKAIDEAYDDIYEAHEYTFYTGKDADNKTHYANHDGNFRSYLLEVTKTNNIKDAKAAIRAEAKEYVTPIFKFYAVAGEYDLLTTKKELKEYKKGDYEYNKYYNGENNALVVYQFDKLMNYFLAIEENEVAEGEEVVVTDNKYTHEFFAGRNLITKAEEK